MRLMFVADGRSPTTRSWLEYWLGIGDEVHLVSTYPCEVIPGLTSLHIIPVAFSGMARSGGALRRSGWVTKLARILRSLRYLAGPATLKRDQRRFLSLVNAIQPDLVHALRIPFEGMLASVTPAGIPLVVSTWGNDLTLHARGSGFMGKLTRQTLQRTDGFLADTRRDVNLSAEWGLKAGTPTAVVPGAGGIRLEKVRMAAMAAVLPEEITDVPLVINARGQRPGSLRQDVFFRSIPRILKLIPETLFICPSLRGEPLAEHWVESLGITRQTRLWPSLTQGQLWALFMKAGIYVSPSIHDGTPNSLLEAMACGCFPVVGDIESMRDWVTDGVNGLLVNANDEKSVTQGILTALTEPALRNQAALLNARLIAERADYLRNMQDVRKFYTRLLSDRLTDYSERGVRKVSSRS